MKLHLTIACVVAAILVWLGGVGTGYMLGTEFSEPKVIVTEQVKLIEVPVPIILYAATPVRFVDPITIDEGLVILEMAQATHQFYYHHPALLTHDYGSPYERMWIDRYQQLKNLLQTWQ